MSVIKSILTFIGGGMEEGDDGYLEDFTVEGQENTRVKGTSGKKSLKISRIKNNDSRPEQQEMKRKKIDRSMEQVPLADVASPKRNVGRVAALPKIITPKSFGDAKILADDFSKQYPVVMDLQGLDRPLARRLIDFASGVCYVLDGSMEKVAPQVFLLLPAESLVSDQERRKLTDKFS